LISNFPFYIQQVQSNPLQAVHVCKHMVFKSGVGLHLGVGTSHKT
jgi:hypothetical protein